MADLAIIAPYLEREGIKTIVKQNGKWNVVAETGEGREALGLLDNASPDLVLVDLDTPNLNGLKDLRQMHLKAPEILVVVMANVPFDIDGWRNSVTGTGAAGYISRKAPTRVLLKALEAALDRRNFIYENKAFIDCTLPYEETLFNMAVPILTEREKEVLALVARGSKLGEVARKLGISYNAVQAHLKKVKAKTGITTRGGLATFALKKGLA